MRAVLADPPARSRPDNEELGIALGRGTAYYSAMADSQGKTPSGTNVTVSAGISPEMDLPAALGANFFHFTVVGPEIQMLVGSVNLLEIHQAKTSGGEIKVTPKISHRFSLSALGFNQLKAQLAELGEIPAPGLAAHTKIQR